MKISVLIPFKRDRGPRELAFWWIRDRWTLLYPEVEICIGESFAGLFNRGQARNDAFSKSTGDIIIINDADTFCSKANLDRAIELAIEGKWTLPYDVYYNLTQGYTEEILDSYENIEPENPEYIFRIDKERHPPDGSVAGVLVMPREAYETVGGYDEEYKTWSYEDDDLALRLDKVWGYHQRLTGSCWHLWHPRSEDADFKDANWNLNRLRFEEKKRAFG